MLNLKPTIISFALIISFSFSAILSSTACSCDYTENFCSAVLEGTNVFLVETKSIISTSQREFRVIEEIMGTSISQDIVVKGQDGLNCLENLDYFEVGDTAVMVLFPDNTLDDNYWLNGCVKSFLEYKDGNVIGTMVPGSSQSTYAEFLVNLSDCIDFISSTKEESISNASLKVFPNPTQDYLNIVLTDRQITGYQLRDLNGAIIDSRINLKLNDLQLNVDTFTSGVYMVSISHGEDIFTRKVVIH